MWRIALNRFIQSFIKKCFCSYFDQFMVPIVTFVKEKKWTKKYLTCFAIQITSTTIQLFWAKRGRRPSFALPEAELFSSSLGNWVDKNEEKILTTTTTRRLDKKWHFFYALKYAVKWPLKFAVKWPYFFFNLFALKNDPIFFTIFLH